MSNKKSKTKKINIKYDGIGANKKIHNKKEFMKISKKHFKDCTSKKCKKNNTCKIRKNLFKRAQQKNKVHIDEYLNAIKECNKCKKKYKCNFKEYIKYSGARLS